MAMPVAVSRIVIAFEARENLPTVPLDGQEVRRPDGVATIAAPDEVSVVTKDVRTCLSGSVLLVGGVLESGERGDKEVSLFDVV